MKMRMQGHKLTDADVQYISLVKGGANRIPVRILKSEDNPQETGMLNLAKVFKGGSSKVQENKAATIVAYLLPKTEHFEEMKAALKSAGAVVDFPEEVKGEDGVSVLFKQEKDLQVDDTMTPVRIGDTTAVLLKAFDPYGGKAQTYTDVLKSQGFLPSLAMANEALYTTIMSTLTDPAITAESLVSKMEPALDEFKTYVMGLCKDIPSTAFKAEAAVSEAYDKAVKKAEKKATKQKDQQLEEDEDKKKSKKNDKVDQTELSQLIKSAVQETVKPLSTSLETLSTSVSGMKDTLEELSEGVDEAKEMAQKAEKAVKGVVPSKESGDQDTSTGTKKSDASEDDDEPMVIDTAFQPKIRTTKASYQDKLEARNNKQSRH
jgi:hypothetical protein